MSLIEHDSVHGEATERAKNENTTTGPDSSADNEARAAALLSSAPSQADRRTRPPSETLETKPDISSDQGAAHGSGRSPGARWWVLAACSALMLAILTMAGVYLITKKPSTIDQLVILTVPSGANIRLNSKDYGNSPVKLEQVPIGNYTLEITKEGYEPIIEEISISASQPALQPLERKLKLLPSMEEMGLSIDELIRLNQQKAEDAFVRGHYWAPAQDNALYYADRVIWHDPSNGFAAEMRERIRRLLHQSAQLAVSRADLGRAQELYEILLKNYPEDQDARAAAWKVENQLSLRKGEVRDLVRKAEEALQAGNLLEPARESAYYYSKEALAIDRQNAQARAIRNSVREQLASAGEQAYRRGDKDAAIKQLEELIQFFPEDRQLQARLREITLQRDAEIAKEHDPNTRRLQGLEKYRREEFADAIRDLEIAMTNGKGGADVVFALAYSHMKLGQLDKAASYFLRVPRDADDTYRSSVAALGEIAQRRGDTATALERYKEARQLGGSVLYDIAKLDDRIERIEKKQREKAAEPTPVSIPVKHLHGSLRGSCSGTLTVSPTGVRYDGGEHNYSSNLVGFRVTITKDEMKLSFTEKLQEFKASPSDAERFREALTRYQGHANR